MTNNNTYGNKSVDEILDSIKNIINNKHNNKFEEEDELELTEVVLSDGEPILSEAARSKTESIIKDFIETADTLGHSISYNNHNNNGGKTIENFMVDLLRPQIKHWLDENLPIIVKQAVSDEIKSLVANIQKNRDIK